MSETARRALREWQEADARARAAESRLREAWDRHDRRDGDAPAPELIAEVSLLRLVANRKLTAALAEMRGPQASAEEPERGSGPQA